MAGTFRASIVSMEHSIDWSELYKTYRGLWVALAEDEKTVLSASHDAKKAYQEALRKGVKVPILVNVPLENIGYVG